jgi:hypothetical protein
MGLQESTRRSSSIPANKLHTPGLRFSSYSNNYKVNPGDRQTGNGGIQIYIRIVERNMLLFHWCRGGKFAEVLMLRALKHGWHEKWEE